MNNVHKKALRIVYDGHNNSYSELPITENKRTIYQQNSENR